MKTWSNRERGGERERKQGIQKQKMRETEVKRYHTELHPIQRKYQETAKKDFFKIMIRKLPTHDSLLRSAQ